MQKEMRKINKKAAIELSISTIVIVVLAMTMLIGGIVLVKNIFAGTTTVVDMTQKQLENQINILFGADQKLAIYPDSGLVKVKQDSINGFGFGIKNLIKGTSTSTKFSYEVVVADPDLRKKCGVSDSVALGWISNGRSDTNIEIASGDLAVAKVLFDIPVGSPLCTVTYRINVKANEQAYATNTMVITIVSK